MNNQTIRVDPHITQYTVYITDNYTGNIIVKENVTEARFSFNVLDYGLCLMYQVSAWNAGGEGELSEPVQDSIPRSKGLLNWLTRSTCMIDVIFVSLSHVVSRNVMTRSITAKVTEEPNVLYIRIDNVSLFITTQLYRCSLP